MIKVRLAAIISIVGTAAILAVSLPVNQAKADHCTDHCDSSKKQITRTEVPNRDANKTVENQASSCERQLTQVNIPSPVNKLSKSRTPSLEEICFKNLPLALLSIDNAIRAAESDDKTTAVVGLLKVRKILISMHDALGDQIKPHFANSHCPVVGSSIDVNKVNESFTRDYKGWKVAFCCAVCPLAWDRYTDAQKQFKLPGVKF